MDQQHYVGLDVSLETTLICVVDRDGIVIWRGKCATDPDAICHAFRTRARRRRDLSPENSASFG
jgi:transposase